MLPDWSSTESTANGDADDDAGAADADDDDDDGDGDGDDDDGRNKWQHRQVAPYPMLVSVMMAQYTEIE